MKEIPAFLNFLRNGIAAGGFRNDDVVAILLPLLEDMKDIHEENEVVNWGNLAAVKIISGKAEADHQYRIPPRLKSDSLQVALFNNQSDAFEITGDLQGKYIPEHENKKKDFDLKIDSESKVQRPVFLSGYRCWEIEFGHHDQSGDIFMAGLLLASLALNLDFTKEADLRKFVENRNRIPELNKALHPAIANLLVEMTEPDRRKRTREIQEAIDRLKHYREFREELLSDLTRIAQFRDKSEQREHFIFRKLKSRLFDLSKRNKLLYFKPNMRFLNLTVSSVPSVLNIKNISQDQLFVWNSDIRKKIAEGKEISLNRYLNFTDYPFIIPSLDKIRLESNRDIQEYGFSQLRLAIAFLNWNATVENITEHIVSPLVLIPVKLIKKKGLTNQFILECGDAEAEINPVLRYRLKELYNIRLPESIDLEKKDLIDLYNEIKSQMHSSASGIRIDFIAKPRISVLHAQARNAVQRFERRIHPENPQLKSYGELHYSYDKSNFRPLGLQLFGKYITTAFTYPQHLIQADISSGTEDSETAVQPEQDVFQLNEGTKNPLRWEFDTCNMTLGNFNFRKMSLLRDYDQILAEQKENVVFSEMFSDSPVELKTEKASDKTYNITGLFQVISSDPTQNNAVRMARNGISYLIQGPPGTGKSQTITNLIADLVACGKKVLFVCEKRVALDVVYYRLKKQNLHEFCCLIHDSQSDKKEFVRDLAQNYHKHCSGKLRIAELDRNRNLLLLSIGNTLRQLDEFHSSLQNTPRDTGLPLHKLYRRLIGLNAKAEENQISKFQDKLPAYIYWIKYGEQLRVLSQVLQKTTGQSIFADNPLARLHKRFLSDATLLDELQKLIPEVQNLLSETTLALNKIGLKPDQFERFSDLEKFTAFYTPLKTLADAELTGLLNASSPEFKELLKLEKEWTQKKKERRRFEKSNANWLSRFSETDLREAIRQWEGFERTIFRFFTPAYYRLKRSIRNRYDFSAHTVRPSISSVLQELMEEYRYGNELEAIRIDFESKYAYENPTDFVAGLKNIHRQKQSSELQFLFSKPNAAECILEMNEISSMLLKAEIQLSALMWGFRELSLQEIGKGLENIRTATGDLSGLIPYLKDLMQADDAFVQAIRTISLSPDEMEAEMALKSLIDIYRNNKTLKHTEGSHILFLIEKLQKEHLQLLDLNAEWIREKQKERILGLIQLSEQNTSRLNKEEKEKKKAVIEGRKILENEFSKSMRYKSIRELTKLESGEIIREMKPVWLMSPLSISDTLPLDDELFDVVIFDEASQITLEEGIPPLFRAKQTIIVGDEMQMPPGNFFAASAKEQDDVWQEEEEEDSINVDAESLLNQAARKLPSVLLGWHYRSRYESLISFSNAAFYEGKLLTIPDRKTFPESGQEIVVSQVSDAGTLCKSIEQRSISFHFMEKGCYENRRNIPEADYIAALVFELIKSGKKNSLGIVAFSQEQQMEIEDALDRYASGDPVLQTLLENEYKRTDDDQFAGLFVKNLENVQGDERDIMIMSVCYGYNAAGKMRMNFGPVNRRGGEKRLNVLFSRARKHMVVVSSVHYTDIRNDYNEGAAYLKRYLRFAELTSIGKTEEAADVLRSMSRENFNSVTKHDSVAGEIAGILRAKGWIVKTNVGQSQFTLSLALKEKESDETFALGILIDDDTHYSDSDTAGILYLRPKSLENFGWRVLQIFTKDWYHQPEKVLLQIEMALRNESPAEELVNPVQERETVQTLVPEDIQQLESAQTENRDNADNRMYFECTENQELKFWEVYTDKNKLYTRFGNSGSKGTLEERIFVSEENAESEMERLIRQKEHAGYIRKK